jgi:hypothetical protein
LEGEQDDDPDEDFGCGADCDAVGDDPICSLLVGLSLGDDLIFDAGPFLFFLFEGYRKTYQGVPNPRVLCWLAILAKLVMRYRPAIIMNIAQQTRVVSGQR